MPYRHEIPAVVITCPSALAAASHAMKTVLQNDLATHHLAMEVKVQGLTEGPVAGNLQADPESLQVRYCLVISAGCV